MHVDPTDLRDAAGEMQAIAADLIADVRSVIAAADSLMLNHWTGVAAESHHTMWTRWADGARQVVCALAYDADLLKRVASEFAASDAHFAQALV